MKKAAGDTEKAPLLRSSLSGSSESSSLRSYGSRGDVGASTSSKQPGTEPSFAKKSKKQKKSAKKQYGFRDVFRYATAGDYVLMFFGIVFSVLHGAGFPILSVVFGGMTNAFLRAEVSNITEKAAVENGVYTSTSMYATSPSYSFRAANESANPTPLPPIGMDEFLDSIIDFAVYYSLIGVAMLITSYAQIACFQSSAERQIVKIRNAFFHSILRQEISWYDRHQTGELTSRLHDDLERIREGIGDKVTIFVQNGASFASGFVIGFVYNWKLTLVMMSLTPVLALSGAFVGRFMANASTREQEKYAKAGGIAEEVISCIRTVIALNGQEREIQRYKEALQAGKEIGIQKYVYSGIGMLVTFFSMFASYALAFWYGSKLIATEPGFTPGEVFTVFFAVMAGSFALGNASPHFSSMATAKGSAATILEIIDSEPSIDPYCVGGLKPDNIKGKIEFHNVRFAYPTRKDVTVLNGISLKVEPGQNVAIVGASGCGKSTMISMLLRFYDVDKGQVTIDGHNVKHLNVHWLRDMMGVVSQEPVLFDGTVEENIRLGNLDASKEQVMEAAKMANAYQFINALPDAFSTRVGERGVQLSGGQKQRIAIARALIRDPKILLLDEATSALDAESEEIVQEALAKAQKGRTTVTIAHRLSTIKDSDLIYVLQFGCLMEQGTHHELMEKRTIYYKMVVNQQLDENVTGYEGEAEDGPGTDTPGAIGGRTTSSGGEGYTSTEPRVLTRRFSSMKGRGGAAGRRESSGGRTSDTEFGSRASIIRKPSYRRSSMSRYESKKSLSRLQSHDLAKLQEEMEEEKVKPTSFKSIYKESRSEWGLMLLGTVGSLLNAVVMPAFALFFSQIFSAYSKTGDEMQKEALLWSMMFLLLGALQGLGFFISFYFFGRAGENLTMKLRLNVFANVLRQDAGYFDDIRHSTGKICTRLSTDAPNVRAAMGTRISFLISAVISMVMGIVVAFIFGWKLALVITAMTPILVLSAYLDMRLQMDSHKRDTTMLEEAGKTASEAISNIRTVQALSREHHFYTTYIGHLKDPFKAAIKNTQLYAIGFGVAQSVSFFMYAASFRYGGHLITKGEIEPVDVFRIFFAISFCAQSIGQASSFIPDYVKAKMSAGLLFYMMNYEPRIDNCSKAGITPETVNGKIDVKNAYFFYPTRPTVRVLQNLTLNIKPGTTLALVGPSGCGKSTVVSLIERYYDPLSGEILIDGTDLRALNLQKARNTMSLVSQEPVLFDCSIWDNIAYALEGKITHERVVEAAKLANIHDFILTLPNGYNTKVGEKGTQLSGGQKQRIAIARSLVRNPKILLLDEATSALDTESERQSKLSILQTFERSSSICKHYKQLYKHELLVTKQLYCFGYKFPTEKVVQDALDKAREGRTCVMIAHRLSTVQSADCIAVIQDGRVVEKGTHSELTAMKGLYSKMTHLQNLGEDA